MSERPTLVLDTCALRHLDGLTLNRRPLVSYLTDGFDVRVPAEIYEELSRQLKGLEDLEVVKKKKIEWRMRCQLTDGCLKSMLQDLPITNDWYPHAKCFPANEDHLFAVDRNAGERALFLLFFELTYAGKTPILLSDDLKACRMALRDLINWKLRSGVLWTTLDFVIYIVVTGLKRAEKKQFVNQFRMADLTGVIRDLVLQVSSQKELQQQLLVHYTFLARMIFDLINSNDEFNQLEKQYAKTRYR